MNKYLINYNDNSFDINCDDSFMCNYYNKHKCFYENVMLDYIKKLEISGIYLDIGAYIGNHSIFFSEICTKSTRVYSYEPVDKSYNLLDQNIKNYSKVVIKKLALGDKNGHCDIILVEENIGMSYVLENENGNIEMVTIDDEFQNTIDKIGLIKIDVEGYEYNVLKGSINTIVKYKPHLFVEVIENINVIESFLRQYGYEIIDKFNNTPTYYFKYN